MSECDGADGQRRQHAARHDQARGGGCAALHAPPALRRRLPPRQRHRTPRYQTRYCLLPIAYCLLPIAYCLLPIAVAACGGGACHCLPISFCFCCCDRGYDYGCCCCPWAHLCLRALCVLCLVPSLGPHVCVCAFSPHSAPMSVLARWQSPGRRRSRCRRRSTAPCSSASGSAGQRRKRGGAPTPLHPSLFPLVVLFLLLLLIQLLPALLLMNCTQHSDAV